MSAQLKECFEPIDVYGSFYTGGEIAWTLDGTEIVCQNNENVNIISVNTGKIINTIGSSDKELDDDKISTFALSNECNFIITSHKSGLLKLWNKNNGSLIKAWKSSHQGPIASLCFKESENIVASGGSDTLVKLWDYEKKICILALKGCKSVVDMLIFYPSNESKLIFATSNESIFCWDYSTKELVQKYIGHISQVTDISFTKHEKFITVGRDKVLILWELKNSNPVRIIPIYETLEGVCVLNNNITLPNGYNITIKGNEDEIFVAIAGESGAIKIWECTKSKIIYTQENSLIKKASEEGGLSITHLLFCEQKSEIAIVSADHNIIIHNLNTFSCTKQLIGFSDEILDIALLGGKSQFLAVATNSSDIKIYDTLNMNCQILNGHTDIVLALTSYGNWLLSSSKDCTIRMWEMNTSTLNFKCVARATKHSSSVGSIDFSKASFKFFVSVSQDNCLKLWKIPKHFQNNEDEIISLQCNATILAHEKNVNCVTVSPNDSIIATASQDKTAKLWSVKGLQLIGVLRGHNRGVWCVRFSPIDQVLLTSSADSTLKLWSITDKNCLKTLEGHESSILRADFITQGQQIISAGADGLLKLWNIRTSECCTTLDKHESRIWSFVFTKDEKYFFSAGSDSKLIKWKDVTDEKKLEEFNMKKEQVLQEQELTNLIAQKKMLKALKLALKFEKPHLTLKIINSVIKNKDTKLDETIENLNEIQKENLLKHAINWNTNSKNSIPAQLVFTILFKEIYAEKFKPNGLERIVEEVLPYTDRHFKRFTEYLRDLKFIEFTMRCMQPNYIMDNKKF